MKILAVDPGDKRIGVAISDPTGLIAKPLSILEHCSREEDARRIIQIADENECQMIVIGQALLVDGQIGYRARSSMRLRDAITNLSLIKTVLWDETGTTKEAISTRIKMGMSQKKRRKHMDDLAAAILLDDFLSSAYFKSLEETNYE